MLTSSPLWFCLGDTQRFFAHSIIVSVLFNDTLCLSLLVSRVLKVGSCLACSVVLFLPCLWVFCFFSPCLWVFCSLIPVLGLLSCLPRSALGQSIPWF